MYKVLYFPVELRVSITNHRFLLLYTKSINITPILFSSHDLQPLTVTMLYLSWIATVTTVRRRWFPSTSPLVSFYTSVFSLDICSFDSFTIQSVRIKTSTFHQLPSSLWLPPCAVPPTLTAAAAMAAAPHYAAGTEDATSSAATATAAVVVVAR
jgi:hypothetical protein